MRTKKSLITIVIPIHNETGSINWHHKKIIKHVNSLSLNYEILYIDDGSTDNSLELVKLLASTDDRVKYISFSRNFGKEAAISAGLKKALGDAVLIIDADGQHPIELIGKFIEKWHEGFDIVVGVRRSNQGEGFIKSAGSRLFYFLLKSIDNGYDVTPASTDFRLVDRLVIDQYNKLTERNRISRNLMDWLGFKKTTLPFDALARHAGKASYSYSKLVKLAIDGAIKHSTRPLKFIGVLGLLISFVTIIAMIFLFVEKYILLDPLHLAVTGTALLALFLSFLVGIVLTCQGLLALYLENVFYETQNRPLYVVREEK
ncbi:MAG: glycosyltransferase [Candidatus Saccharibacteria bacterium]|nr:glycosyltransferase [Candidatus Saccharibacteria bacterium]